MKTNTLIILASNWGERNHGDPRWPVVMVVLIFFAFLAISAFFCRK